MKPLLARRASPWHALSVRLGSLAVLLLAAAGCGAAADIGLPGAKDPPCELTYEYYLIDRIALPASIEEANDQVEIPILDGVYANWMGHGIGYFQEVLGVDFQPALDRALASREILWVLEIGSCPDRDHARLNLLPATAAGDDRVRIEDVDPVPAVGTWKGDQLSAREGAGYAPLSSLLDIAADVEPPVWMPVLAAGAELVKSAKDDRLRGTLMMAFQRLGTMFRGEDSADALFRSIVSPPLARMFNEAVRLDAGCPEDCGSVVELLLDTFDENDDGSFTGAEVLANSDGNLFYGFSRPHIDLLFQRDDGEVVYRPGHDGDDHIALHLTIQARPIDVEE